MHQCEYYIHYLPTDKWSSEYLYIVLENRNNTLYKSHVPATLCLTQEAACCIEAASCAVQFLWKYKKCTAR